MSTASPQAIFLEHESWLRTVVRSRLNEPDAVEDVMQNIALAIVRHRGVLHEVNRLGAWLYQVAVRQVLMYRRASGRRRRMHERLQTAVPHNADTLEPLQALLTQEAKQSLQEAMSELNELDRQILMLKYSEGWSYREIAEHLGVQEDTIEYRLLRARKNLRRQLRQFSQEGGSQC